MLGFQTGSRWRRTGWYPSQIAAGQNDPFPETEEDLVLHAKVGGFHSGSVHC